MLDGKQMRQVVSDEKCRQKRRVLQGKRESGRSEMVMQNRAAENTNCKAGCCWTPLWVRGP